MRQLQHFQPQHWQSLANRMFNGCTALKTAPELKTTTLAENCYNGMFWGCSTLEAAPELPATTLASSCYNAMFQGCTALKTAPELKATTLAESCYNSMFWGCSTLEAAPALPATTLEKSCYQNMFKGCTLTTAPTLPATTLAENCYGGMFWDCRTLTTAPALPATTLAESCYNSMFQSCAKLNYVKVGFTDWSEGRCTSDWLLNAGTIAINPTFECSEVLDMNKRDDSHVPSKWTITRTSPAYLCIKAEEAGAKVQLKKNGSPAAVTIEYSRDGGANWTTVDFSTVETTGDITLTNVGDKVYFRNNGTSATFSQSADNYYQFVMSGNVAASGNVMSLIDNNMESTTIPCNYCFYNLFNNCTELINAANLKLPATTLAEACYQNMFEDCISLEVAPALPAETLVKNCYNKMFEDCISLEAAPALPATTLAEACYRNMFSGCIALTAAPELKTTTLAENCYGGMFLNCISLEAAPALPAETLIKNCYREMFEGCTALTKAPALPATTLADICYYRMFLGCTALTDAPELKATTLAESCYNNMFNSCTALEIAPELPAETLAKSCYNSMFQGCVKLNYVKVGFKGWGDVLCTGSWLSGAGKKAGNKIFVCPEELDVNTRDDNHVPNGWMIMTGTITLDDNDPYNVTIDIEDVKLKYKRAFTETGKYEALYLPFSVTMTKDLLDKVTIAQIYMVSTKGSVEGGTKDVGVNVVVVKTLVEGETTNPHTPYFIRTKTDTNFEFEQEHTTLYAATNAKPEHIDCSTITDKYNFIGNYTGVTMTPEAGKSIYVLQGGALHKVTSETDLHCNRWQMVKTPRSWTETPVGIDSQAKMQIVTLGEDDTTGIEGIEASPKSSPEGKDFMFNLQGQRVSSFNGYRGVVIKGGKKYIMK
ncbi:MAG: leucine-rich repeat protein [Prevotella sp.]|nr:leucine-rich repeat protein [Candidatus Equicola stercoris]